MAAAFKCCRKEPLNSIYCVGCENIFHKECAEKRRDKTVLGNNKFYCSKKCVRDDKVLKLEQYVKELQTEIKGMQEELDAKDAKLLSLRRSSAIFEGDVLDAEQGYQQ